VLASIRVDTPARKAAREALSTGVAVVTGQQAGLFGGPLYTVYKAASAIVNARALTAQTGIPCAPVFWLQDEDHDFDEIASIGLLDRSGALRRASVSGIPAESGRSVAFRRYGPEIETALELLSDCIDGLPFADEVAALLSAGPDDTPSRAFVRIIDRLFAEHGLLVVDAAHPTLREAARPVHERAFADAGPIADALLRQASALEADGRSAPIHVRPDAPLSFVHPDGPEGPRWRIEPNRAGASHPWSVCGTDQTLSADTVNQAARSTSALLRPILQDVWLPTAAYVGGPGELRYLAQMPPLYEAYGLPTPLIVPRARFLLLDGGSRRLLDQLALQPSELNQPREALLAQLGTARGDLPDPDALRDATLAGAIEALNRFRPVASELDAGLAKSVDKTLDHITSSVDKLLDRYAKALARDDSILVDRLDRLLARLRPDGAPQERVFAFAPFAARSGIDAFVQSVLDATRPFDGDLRELPL
jgi:bacillithiol biosynthesis cysteine-adding enzyme BshC